MTNRRSYKARPSRASLTFARRVLPRNLPLPARVPDPISDERRRRRETDVNPRRTTLRVRCRRELAVYIRRSHRIFINVREGRLRGVVLAARTSLPVRPAVAVERGRSDRRQRDSRDGIPRSSPKRTELDFQFPPAPSIIADNPSR